MGLNLMDVLEGRIEFPECARTRQHAAQTDGNPACLLHLDQ